MRPADLSRALATTALAVALAACDAAGPARTSEPAPAPDSIARAVGATPVATTANQPAATALVTETATPDATAAAAHPLSIARARDGRYPGSELDVIADLPAGAGYDRRVVSYESEGLRIHALLTVPGGEPPPGGWPAVVFNHGYIPPSQYRTTERYVAYVDAFARRGFVVLKSDYRGHGDSEGDARGGYGAPDYTVDVLNGLASVRRMPEVDPDRVGMWGHSMGGHITLRSMVVTDTIRAGVIWAGVVASYPDLVERWRRRPTADAASPAVPTAIAAGARRWRDELVRRFGSPSANPELWASISANTYLADLSGPLQLHHGTADHSVPLEFTLKLEEQVRQAGGEVETYVYDGDDHNISRNLSTALERSVSFLESHLAPRPLAAGR